MVTDEPLLRWALWISYNKSRFKNFRRVPAQWLVDPVEYVSAILNGLCVGRLLLNGLRYFGRLHEPSFA